LRHLDRIYDEHRAEDELRLMLGENAIRFFELDLDRLAEIARLIGPTVAEIHAGGPVRPELIENFACALATSSPLKAKPSSRWPSASFGTTSSAGA
jgi:hypothetical protein